MQESKTITIDCSKSCDFPNNSVFKKSGSTFYFISVIFIYFHAFSLRKVNNLNNLQKEQIKIVIKNLLYC